MASVDEIVESTVQYVVQSRETVHIPGDVLRHHQLTKLNKQYPQVMMEERYDHGFYVAVMLKNQPRT